LLLLLFFFSFLYTFVFSYATSEIFSHRGQISGNEDINLRNEDNEKFPLVAYVTASQSEAPTNQRFYVDRA